jgi:hypothetical protein
MYFDFLQFCLKHSSFYDEFTKTLPQISVILHVKYCYCCRILTKLKFPIQICEKSSNIKFNENLPIGSRVIPRGRKDEQTDTMELTAAFGKCANAPEKGPVMKLKVLIPKSQV